MTRTRTECIAAGAALAAALERHEALTPRQSGRSCAPAMSSREVDALFRGNLCEADLYARKTGDPEGRIAPWKRRLLCCGVRLGARANHARRAGWIQDAPAVASITVAVAVPVVAAVVAADRAAHSIRKLI